MFVLKKILIYSSLFLFLYACKNEKKDAYGSVTKDNSVFISDKQIPDDHFLGDKKCKECHQDQFKDWEGSHHDKAMQIATRESILADFKGEKFSSQGVNSHFFEKKGEFFANTEGPDGKNHDYKIVYTFGITPLQQYIVQFPDGHFQCLRTAWDSKKNKWFDLYPNFKVVHSEWLHWSRGGLNWNNMCADCHSTNVRKNYDSDKHSYDTKFALINVSCEACHGPGKQHVSDVATQGKSYQNTGTMKMTLDTKPKELVDQCARCHVRREQFSGNYNYEGTFLDHYFPQLITQPIYYSDGQILDEDYVYGSFVQSKMYKHDVTCTNCHNPHSTKLKLQGNALCSQCHDTKKYDTEKHHKHPMGSESAQCINCHMPGRFYMGNDFRRDHSFRIPRPDLSLAYNTPNVCTGCHKDKDNKWATKKFVELYGEPKKNHFSDLLTLGLSGTGTPEVLAALHKLAQDTIYPEIARASAIKELANYKNLISPNQLLRYLKDPSALIRGTGADAISVLGNTQNYNALIPLLNDPKRTVRLKTFSAIGGLNETQIPASYKSIYQKVKKEWTVYMAANADFTGGKMNKASYLLKKGDLKGAIGLHLNALKYDPINNIVRSNLANLYYQNKEYAKAENAFKTIIKQEPGYGPIYYSYGLLLAELKRTDDAIVQMELASKYMKDNTRIYYNLSLLYDGANKASKAESTLLNGLKIAPKDESLLYALAYHYANHNAKEKAKNVVLTMIKLFPNNPQYPAFLQQLN